MRSLKGVRHLSSCGFGWDHPSLLSPINEAKLLNDLGQCKVDSVLLGYAGFLGNYMYVAWCLYVQH